MDYRQAKSTISSCVIWVFGGVGGGGGGGCGMGNGGWGVVGVGEGAGNYVPANVSPCPQAGLGL